MNKNVLIVLGGAVMAAVLVAVLVQMTLGGGKSSSGPTVKVLVAAQNLKVGHVLEEGDTKWTDWPKSAVFKGAVVQKDDKKAHEALEGRISYSIAKGEPISRRAILSDTKGNFVAASLSAGERAVGIKVAVESVAAGFITPGSYVDVILTYKNKIEVDREEDVDVRNMIEMNLDKMATETILENVRVLAIDQDAKPAGNDDKKLKMGRTKIVTLAVTARDAEKLSLASEMGTINLAMRGVGDDKPNEPAPVVSDARLMKIDDEIFSEYRNMKEGGGPLPSMAAVPSTEPTNQRRRTRGSVKVYNGGDVSEISVR